MTKIETYVGFAIKKGAVVYGIDNITAYHKRMHVIFADPELSERGMYSIKAFAESRKIPLLVKKELYLVINKQNCKAFAVTDKHLAGAILNNVDEDYSIGGIEIDRN